MTLEDSKLLTIEEVSVILRCCKATVRNRIRRGLLPCVYVGSIPRYVRESDLEASMTPKVEVSNGKEYK